MSFFVYYSIKTDKFESMTLAPRVLTNLILTGSYRFNHNSRSRLSCNEIVIMPNVVCNSTHYLSKRLWNVASGFRQAEKWSVHSLPYFYAAHKKKIMIYIKVTIKHDRSEIRAFNDWSSVGSALLYLQLFYRPARNESYYEIIV